MPIPVSFEFYPPKTDEQRAQLDRTAYKLKAHAPEYVSCTFGAGGSTLSYTSETVRHLNQHHGFDAAPHLSCVGGSREEIRERVEDIGRHLVHRMERFLNTLGTIAAAGPLLGLFGTVVGMIEMFLGILDHGIGDANQLAGGIGKALVCTATGMLVAIPALVFHRYFRGLIAGYIVDMEHEAIRLLDVLDAHPAPKSH